MFGMVHKGVPAPPGLGYLAAGRSYPPPAPSTEAHRIASPDSRDNRLLDALPAAVWERWKPHLEIVPLRSGRCCTNRARH